MDNTTVIYHGSKQIVEFPEIRLARYHKDFYFGFYCTKLLSQAERLAVRYTGEGTVTEYLYTPDENLKVLKFDEMTEGWLDFIVSCRGGMPMIMILWRDLWQTTGFSIIFRISQMGKFPGRLSGSWQNSTSPHIRSVFIQCGH